MKGSINLEFEDGELRKFVEDAGRRWTLNTIHDLLKHLRDPRVAQLITQLFHTAIEAGASIGRQPPSPDVGRGPPPYAPPSPDIGRGPPPYAPPSPPRPTGGAPSHVAGMPFGDMMEQFLRRPQEGTPSPREGGLKYCMPIEANPYQEKGWMCHECSIYNGAQRSVCRECEHERCDEAKRPPDDDGIPSGSA